MRNYAVETSLCFLLGVEDFLNPSSFPAYAEASSFAKATVDRSVGRLPFV